jgi:hypothetical protein
MNDAQGNTQFFWAVIRRDDVVHNQQAGDARD